MTRRKDIWNLGTSCEVIAVDEADDDEELNWGGRDSLGKTTRGISLRGYQKDIFMNAMYDLKETRRRVRRLL